MLISCTEPRLNIDSTKPPSGFKALLAVARDDVEGHVSLASFLASMSAMSVIPRNLVMTDLELLLQLKTIL